MRVLLALAAAIGLAAAPCAWDDDPREAPSILALLSQPPPFLCRPLFAPACRHIGSSEHAPTVRTKT